MLTDTHEKGSNWGEELPPAIGWRGVVWTSLQ